MAREYMDKEAGRKFILHLGGLLDWLNIQFFLMQGTALGAHRDKGFVPTELDIDFGILYENLIDKVPNLLTVLNYEGYELVTIRRPFSYCRTIVAYKDGIKADLVSFNLHNGKRYACSPIDPVNIPVPYAIVHDAKLLETYQDVEMFDRLWKVPCPIETYLELEYGDWKTPREDHVSRTRVYDFLQKEKIDVSNT